jgi:dCMP deaminase
LYLYEGSKEKGGISIMNHTPISWEEYFMGIASLSEKRSKDPSTQVGSCIVTPDKKIVGTGYNGMPLGADNDFPWGKEGEWNQTKYKFVVHAELNAILNSTRELKGCTIYTTLFPCSECAKAIVQSGIKEVVYLSDKKEGTDDNKASKGIFAICGVNYRQFVTK